MHTCVRRGLIRWRPLYATCHACLCAGSFRIVSTSYFEYRVNCSCLLCCGTLAFQADAPLHLISPTSQAQENYPTSVCMSPHKGATLNCQSQIEQTTESCKNLWESPHPSTVSTKLLCWWVPMMSLYQNVTCLQIYTKTWYSSPLVYIMTYRAKRWPPTQQKTLPGLTVQDLR